MTPQATNASAATLKLYGDTFRSIRHRAAAHLGVADEDSVSPMAIVRYLVEGKPNWAKRTWILYRCATRCGLRQAASSADECEQAAYTHALDALELETQSQAKRKGSATSSKKSKKVSREDIDRLIGHLRKQKSRRLAIQTFAFISATLITGLRPSEWRGSELDQEPDGTWRLRVRNAKATNGRGNGSTRTLRLLDVTDNDLMVIRGMTAIAAAVDLEPGGYAAWQARLRHYLYRATRSALGKRANYPSLYTFRHQFAADAKASRSREEVAALMGHSSAATAGRNYAKRRQAGGSIRVAADPVQVRTVRNPESAVYFASKRQVASALPE